VQRTLLWLPAAPVACVRVQYTKPCVPQSVVRYLSVKSLGRAICVCKSWKAVALSEEGSGTATAPCSTRRYSARRSPNRSPRPAGSTASSCKCQLCLMSLYCSTVALWHGALLDLLLPLTVSKESEVSLCHCLTLSPCHCFTVSLCHCHSPAPAPAGTASCPPPGPPSSPLRFKTSPSSWIFPTTAPLCSRTCSATGRPAPFVPYSPDCYVRLWYSKRLPPLFELARQGRAPAQIPVPALRLSMPMPVLVPLGARAYACACA